MKTENLKGLLPLWSLNLFSIGEYCNFTPKLVLL